jgi:hypothetical protein
VNEEQPKPSLLAELLSNPEVVELFRAIEEDEFHASDVEKAPPKPKPETWRDRPSQL